MVYEARDQDCTVREPIARTHETTFIVDSVRNRISRPTQDQRQGKYLATISRHGKEEAETWALNDGRDEENEGQVCWQ